MMMVRVRRRLVAPGRLWRQRPRLASAIVVAAIFAAVLVSTMSPFLQQHPNGRPPSTVYLADHRGVAVEDLPNPYHSLNDLKHAELYPSADERHMVDPPPDTSVVLVNCRTTSGPWSIAVHRSWAPFGADRFLDMVESGYFRHKVPLMRCVQGYICQFGLAGTASALWTKKIPDDPQWLPDCEVNAKDVRRFARGYFGYAGGGPQTRGRQFFVALDANRELGSPAAVWEVPWGELVGEHSYQTLSRIYTGYGEDGPDQNALLESTAHIYTALEFPLLDYILDCEKVDERVFS